MANPRVKQPVPLCTKCLSRPRRPGNQRWCKSCHAEKMVEYRAGKGTERSRHYKGKRS